MQNGDTFTMPFSMQKKKHPYLGAMLVLRNTYILYILCDIRVTLESARVFKGGTWTKKIWVLGKLSVKG